MTTRVPPQPTANPLSLSFAAVRHFMQATPSAKDVACITIHCVGSGGGGAREAAGFCMPNSSSRSGAEEPGNEATREG